jgi:hypothetical protein
MEMGLGMLEGGRKYGAHNYRKMGVLASVYYDAAMRHIMDWWEGQDIDPDSGLHHISKALSDLCVLRDSMFMENMIDDRPLCLPGKLDIDGLNSKAAALVEKYPNPVKPYLEIDRKDTDDTTNGHGQGNYQTIQEKSTVLSRFLWRITLCYQNYLDKSSDC